MASSSNIFSISPISLSPFKSICVFGNGGPDMDPEILVEARKLGVILALKGIRLIYGGGNVGLMATLAREVELNGGKVIGVIPATLKPYAGETIGLEVEVSSMSEMTLKMLELSDAFIALPGGLFTLSHIFTIACWSQFNIHRKPIGLLNIKGFYDGLLSFLDVASGKKILSSLARNSIISVSTPDDLITKLQRHIPLLEQQALFFDWSNGRKRKASWLDLGL